MADRLIFPIGFDLESAVKKAESEGEVALKRMEKAFSRQPLAITIDTKSFAEMGQSIDTLKARVKEIKKEWDAMPTSAKFDLDAEGKVKQLTAEGKALWDELNRIIETLKGVGQGITQFAAANEKQLAKEAADTAKFEQQMREAEIRRHNEKENLRLKEQASDEKRYQKWLADKEKEVQKEQEAAQKRQNAQERAANAARKAMRDEQIAAYETARALRAQEDVIGNLTKKLSIYQQQIQGQKVGSDAWNKTALEIRRITEELQKANQQMMDFQQKSFSGLSDSLTQGKVQTLTQFREQLRQIEQDFNRLNQTGAAFNPNGGLTTAANDILKQREQIIKQINQMLMTAADAQVQREKEINAVIEQRKTKEEQIKAARQAQLAQLKQKRAENDRIRKILAAEENTIGAITAKLQVQQQRLNSASFGSNKFNKITAEVERLIKKLDEAKAKIAEATGQSKPNVDKVTEAIKTQDGYVSRLIKRLAVYASFQSVSTFLTSIREVTAQFELQRISLGAIIQDQQRANQLFEEIKTFALKSPVKILDLTKYTKQLAAYKIGVDELFETTKRLTDVSVGLGVSMDRVVLAYGQIRARGALYSSEIRQLTEMGIPIVEELASKLTKMNGELVTTAQVLKMVENREIPFQLVKEVFEDMTNKGGIFYEMQEKQGNTLYGMWQKLGDAAAVMYDSIGNTSSVNEGMKMIIQTLRYLMLHWKQTGTVLAGVTTLLVANIVASKNAALATAAASTANQAHIASLSQKVAALRLEQMSLKSTAIFQRLHTAATISATRAQIAAANSTNIFSKALHMMKAALLTNPLTALAVALTTIITLLYQAESEFDKLNQKLEDINRDYDKQNQDSVNRFKELVKAVQENVDGSNAQKEALEELDRTYGKILGSEALELENLNAMGDEYGELIDLIETYNEKKKGEEKATAIKSSYATILDEEKDDLMDYLNQAGMTAEKQAEFIARLNEKILEGKDAITATDETFAEFADDISQLDAAGNIINVLNLNKLVDAWGVGFRQIGGWFGGQGMDYLYNYANALEGQNKALDENEQKTRLAANATGEYFTDIDNLSKAFKNLDFSSWEAFIKTIDKYNGEHPLNNLNILPFANLTEVFDPSKAETEYDKMIEMSNIKIEALFRSIRTIAQQEGVNIPEEFYIQAKSVVDGNKDFSFINWEELEKLPMSEKAKAALRSYKQFYEGIAPTDETIRVFNRKFMELSDNFDISAQKLSKYMMKSGDTLGEHRKKLSDEVTNLLKEIARLEWTKKMLSMFGLPADAVEEKIQESQETVKLLQQMIADIPDIEAIGKKNKGGSKSDPRLQNLKEEISLVQKLYQEYQQLEKQEGASKAASDMERMAKASIDALSKKYGISLPKTAKDLTSALEILYKKMAALPKKVFPTLDKELNELRWTIEKVNIDDSQKNIEKSLKDLSDRISRTKTAKEFYEKILKSTRDVNLAENMTLSVFGIDGNGLAKQTADQVRTLAESIGKDIPKGIINLDEAINPTKLREWADELAKIEGATEVAEKLKKIADDEEKVDQRRHDLWAKDLEKAKEYADKRIELAQYTADQIAEIEAKQRMLDPNDANYKAQTAAYEQMIRGYREREKTEAAKLDYEQVKEQIGMFDDLGVRIGSAFEQILADLKAYAQSPEFARLGLEAQKNVYAQIAKIEDRMAEGFQGIGIGTVSEYVREYSSAASEYLTAQNELKNVTIAAIDADKKYNEAKKSGNQATIDAALAEKQLADSRVATATAAVNTAGANLQRTQSNAARASEKFNNNLQKVESSLQSLNNGALKALWDLLGGKGKRSVGEFLSGSYKMVDAVEKLTKALADSGSDMGKLSKSIVETLATALSGINPEDSEAIAKAATESLKQTLSSVINDKGVVELLSNTLSKNIGEIASQALSGVLSTEDAVNKVGALIDGIADAASATGEMWGAIISLVLSLLDEFAENGIGTFLGELLDKVGEAVEGILANLLTESIPKILGSVGNIVKGVGTGLGDLLTFGIFDLTGQKRVKKANKEIERQQELLDQLEYAYGRLEKAAEKAFGGDYISNFKAQQKNLQAQALAYQKQANAERSKGKKADEEKIKEYEEKYRETMDEIADMQGQIAAQMLGTDLTSAARDFAKAWLDAYKEFGNTADAMSEKFKEMVENMVVEGALSKVMGRALQPMFDMIDNMGDTDFYSEDFWKNVVAKAEQGAKDADYGAQTMMKFLEQAGISMRDLGGGLTGISRDIASASEESINGLAAGINTQNYYISQICANVERIAAQMCLGGGTAAAYAVDYTPLIQQSLENQAMMVRYQAETVAECRNIAARCQEQTETLRRVIVPAGATKATASVAVRLTGGK